MPNRSLTGTSPLPEYSSTFFAAASQNTVLLGKSPSSRQSQAAIVGLTRHISHRPSHMNTLRVPAIPALILMICVLCAFGYSYPVLFCRDWYTETNLLEWVATALNAIISIFLFRVLANPTPVALLMPITTVAWISKPATPLARLCPVMLVIPSGVPLILWESYWYLRSCKGPILNSKTLIAFEGFDVFLHLAWLYLFVVFIWIMCSKRWIGSRTYTTAIILMQLIYLHFSLGFGTFALDYTIMD